MDADSVPNTPLAHAILKALVDSRAGRNYYDDTRMLLGVLAPFIAQTEGQARAADVETRIGHVADEAFGPFPVQTVEENLTAIERGIFELRRKVRKVRQAVEWQTARAKKVRDSPIGEPTDMGPAYVLTALGIVESALSDGEPSPTLVDAATMTVIEPIRPAVCGHPSRDEDGRCHTCGSPPPVDRSAISTLHGTPVDELRAQHAAEPTGQHADYIVLSPTERAKGFVRPVRRTYLHLKCGSSTTMGLSLAETYARDPKFYGSTFCCSCNAHFPVGPDGEFVWDGTADKVGT